VLYQVEQRGRQTAFVGEDGAGLVGLYPLLARAAAIAENENSSFAEALSLAAAERGTPLRRVFADEAEALSHDLLKPLFIGNDEWISLRKCGIVLLHGQPTGA
jgi:hypothetical protein